MWAQCVSCLVLATCRGFEWNDKQLFHRSRCCLLAVWCANSVAFANFGVQSCAVALVTYRQGGCNSKRVCVQTLLVDSSTQKCCVCHCVELLCVSYQFHHWMHQLSASECLCEVCSRDSQVTTG
jgi:hypothetical protein